MIAFITCKSTLVPFLEGVCSSNSCRFELESSLNPIFRIWVKPAQPERCPNKFWEHFGGDFAPFKKLGSSRLNPSFFKKKKRVEPAQLEFCSE